MAGQGRKKRTNSSDNDFFLNDEFGFLAEKRSRVPPGRARYNKAGYPLIGKVVEIKQPEYKPHHYNINIRAKQRRRRTKS